MAIILISLISFAWASYGTGCGVLVGLDLQACQNQYEFIRPQLSLPQFQFIQPQFTLPHLQYISPVYTYQVSNVEQLGCQNGIQFAGCGLNLAQGDTNDQGCSSICRGSRLYRRDRNIQRAQSCGCSEIQESEIQGFQPIDEGNNEDVGLEDEETSEPQGQIDSPQQQARQPSMPSQGQYISQQQAEQPRIPSQEVVMDPESCAPETAISQHFTLLPQDSKPSFGISTPVSSQQQIPEVGSFPPRTTHLKQLHDAQHSTSSGY